MPSDGNVSPVSQSVLPGIGKVHPFFACPTIQKACAESKVIEVIKVIEGNDSQLSTKGLDSHFL